MREKLVARFSGFGIEPDRLILDGRFASHEAHFQACHHVDIALDPRLSRHNDDGGGALAGGVPVWAMREQRLISHQGETILHNVGLSE